MSAFLQWNPLIFTTVMAIVATAIVVPLTVWSARRGHPQFDLDRTVTVVGSGFFLISAFVTNTVWGSEAYHHQLIVKEFAAASNLAEDVIWYTKNGEIDPALGNRLLDELQNYGNAVRDEELTQLTGMPNFPAGQGSPRATGALKEVGNVLDEHALRDPEMGTTQLWDWWRDLTNHRTERLSLSVPVAPAMFGILLVTALATLVLLGIYPAGPDRSARWIAAMVGGVVIVAMFGAVLLLLYPGTQQEARQAPVNGLNSMIATRS